MILLYNPVTGQNALSDGASYTSPAILELNILIELRVLTQLLADVNGATDELDRMRKDVVSEVRLTP